MTELVKKDGKYARVQLATSASGDWQAVLTALGLPTTQVSEFLLGVSSAGLVEVQINRYVSVDELAALRKAVEAGVVTVSDTVSLTNLKEILA